MRSYTVVSVLALLSTSSTVLGQQTAWGQCGGEGWTGPTTCVAGLVCVYSHQWYSQCLQAPVTTAGPATTKSTTIQTSSSTTLRTSTISSTTTRIGTTTTSIRTSSTTSIVPTTTSTRTTTAIISTTSPVTGTYPGPTLLPNYLWIRAVTAPHFHEYLQSPSSTAIISSHLTAGQFQISAAGQLIQLTSAGPLYANVEQRSDATDLLLGVTFTSTPNAFGTFNWSGDSLQWTVGSITRPNPSAWYVCGDGNQLFINLGQYLYGTPAGCSDHTIHFYNGATADF